MSPPSERAEQVKMPKLPGVGAVSLVLGIGFLLGTLAEIPEPPWDVIGLIFLGLGIGFNLGVFITIWVLDSGSNSNPTSGLGAPPELKKMIQNIQIQSAERKIKREGKMKN